MPSATSPPDRWPLSLQPYLPAPAHPEGTIRLDCNESALGPFPAAVAAITAAASDAHRYPDRDGVLIEALAARHGLAPEMIVLGNGADALIGYISAAFLSSGDEVVTGWPSFPTYLIDAAKQGAEAKLVPLADGAVDLDAIAARIGSRTRLVWICTPNNPTGGAVSPADLHRFLDGVPDDVLVVVDEAYHEFAAGPDQVDAIADHVGERPNVAVLRTFSKLYGLAGLRVGYLAGPREVAAAVGKGRHYYDVAGLATIAALASLKDDQEVARRRGFVDARRDELQRGLDERGWRWQPSLANFLAVRVGDADGVCSRLLAGGVATRSLSGLGEPGLLRVTLGTSTEIVRLLELLGPGPE